MIRELPISHISETKLIDLDTNNYAMVFACRDFRKKAMSHEKWGGAAISMSIYYDFG